MNNNIDHLRTLRSTLWAQLMALDSAIDLMTRIQDDITPHDAASDPEPVCDHGPTADYGEGPAPWECAECNTLNPAGTVYCIHCKAPADGGKKKTKTTKKKAAQGGGIVL